MHLFGLSVSVAIGLSSLLVQSVAGITIGRVNNEPVPDALLDVEGGSQPRLLNTVFRKFKGHGAAKIQRYIESQVSVFNYQSSTFFHIDMSLKMNFFP